MEAQDLNLCQHMFVDQLINQGDIVKWAAVGDTRQAIYGFGGSFSSSFDVFRQRENVVELPLTVCYRCPSRIVSEANKVYDVMASFKPDGYIGYATSAKEVKPGSLIICRNSFPLFYVYFQLLIENKRAYIKGEEVLAGLMRFIKPYGKLPVLSALKEMDKDLKEWEKVKEKSRDAKYRFYKFRENKSIFTILAMNVNLRHNATVDDIVSNLESVFKKGSEEDTIILSTIHKSKGLEHPVVYILNEDLIPSPFAETPIQLEQEQNLKYVARTRASKELHYLQIIIK